MLLIINLSIEKVQHFETIRETYILYTSTQLYYYLHLRQIGSLILFIYNTYHIFFTNVYYKVSLIKISANAFLGSILTYVHLWMVSTSAWFCPNISTSYIMYSSNRYTTDIFSSAHHRKERSKIGNVRNKFDEEIWNLKDKMLS